jgi:F0F1-type ATP synthase membrane subunit b/b'
MEKTLQDLADLVLAAIPTIVLVVVLHIYLKAVFFRPLEKVLAERDAATRGALRDAEASLKRAEEKAEEYEVALRNARTEILQAQEAERQKLRREQSEAVVVARKRGSELIEDARKKIGAEADAARQALAGDTERLAGQIVAAVLKGSRN